MKKYLHHPLISLKPETYLSLIIFLSPFANFLSGINVDIYSPSMPTIATFFHATIVATKNTITATLLGWSLGAVFFGILIDSIGRKKVLVTGIFFYLLASIAASFSHTIHELMLVRFVQGFSIASISIGCRVLIIDVVSGKRYAVAILYTSLGYGMGPIIGPFVGGMLQHYFGWQANFIALAVLSSIILFLLLIFVKESIPVRHPLKLKHAATRCFSVLSNKTFMAGVVVGGIGQIQTMLYPTFGPFVVEKVLHQTVLVYGNSALIIGASYLLGTLVCRALLKYFSVRAICDGGFFILLLGIVFSFLFIWIAPLDLTTIMLPLMFTSMGVGMVYPSLLGTNLKKFSHTAGIAMAIQSSGVLLSSAIGIFFISQVHIERLSQLFGILLPLGLLETLIFYGFYRSVFSES